MNLSFWNNRTRRHIIKKFTDKVGLIYFGFVNQNSDNHKIIRGFTASSSHKDNHYSVGSVNGYDVMLVDRSNKIYLSDGSKMVFNWLIMSFNLHTKKRVPHFFISSNNHDMKPYSALFSSFPNMLLVNFGSFENYSQEFTSRFSVYARPSRSVEVERLFPEKVTRVMSVHFWPLSIEQHNNILYVYAVNQKIDMILMNTMIETGLWMCSHLDLQEELI